MLSRAARAMWAAVVPRVRPVMVPLACWFQYGAPRPANAGTKQTPSAELTRDARVSTSDDCRMMPSPSRSHWTTAPPIKILPSRA